MYNLYISLHERVCLCVCVCIIHSDRASIVQYVFVSIRSHFINRACIIHVFIFKHSIKDTANSYADKQQMTQYIFYFFHWPLASPTRKCELLSSSNRKVLERARSDNVKMA